MPAARPRIVLTFLLALGAAGAFRSPAFGAVHPRLDLADPAVIEAELDSYSVRITRDPYCLAVLREGRTVAEGIPGGTALVRAGRRHALERVVAAAALDAGLELRVQAQGELPVTVRLTFFADHFLVSWSPADGLPGARLEESFRLRDGGHWYGGNVTSGHHWPLESAEIELDPFLATSNQTSPFWLTSSGTGFFLPTYQPLGFSINKGGEGLFRFNVKDSGSLDYRVIVGRDIVAVYDSFIAMVGKPAAIPPRGYFASPIFNTWIEFQTDQRQEKILAYARTLREHRFGCEVLMIDDRWQSRYGDHAFDPEKFPNPRQLVDELHRMGFKVVLWDVPFVDPKAANYRFLERKNWLVREGKTGKPALVEWWNGSSALVDLSHPEAFGWFVGELKKLQAEYGVDGFKLDAGDAEYFLPGFSTYGNVTPNRYTDLFAAVGAHFEINELRVSWLVQGLGLVQRLRDKNSDWDPATGLGALIPHGLTESLLGYGYFCPDLIGGGEAGDFERDQYGGMDPEMFVRWTQASALMPMMQFSFAPWHLDPESEKICLKYTRLHEQLGDYIHSLALEAHRTGRPLIRPLFFRDPGDEQAYLARQEFLLGDRFLVAPVLEKGAVSREVYLPAGLWKDFWSGELYRGGTTLAAYPAPLDKLPIFVSLD